MRKRYLIYTMICGTRYLVGMYKAKRFALKILESHNEYEMEEYYE